MKAFHRHLITAALLVTMAVVGIRPASADEPIDVSGAIRIVAAFAEPAPAGACTKVRFELINDSRDDLQIIGLQTDIALLSRLRATVGAQQTVTLGSFGVPADETVDFARFRWFELCGLTRSLRQGEDFTAELRTVRWTTTLSIHVH